MALTPHSQPHYDSLYDDSFYNVDDAGSVSRHQSVQQLPSLSVQTTQQRPQSIQQRQTIQQSHPPIHSVESESGSFYNINVPIAELGSYHQRNNATQQPERSPVDFVGHGWTQNDFQPGQALPGRNENIMGSLTPEEIAEIDTLCGLPALLQLIEMGFPPEHARIALRQCDGNLDRATMFCLENDAQQMNFFLRAELEQRTQNVPEPVTVVRAGGQPVSQQVTPSPSVSPVAVAGGTPTAGSAPKEKKSLFRKLFKSSNTASKRSAGTTTTIVQQQTQQQAQPRVQQPQQQPHQQPHQHQQPQQLQQLTAAHPNPHFVGAQVVTSLLVPAPIPSARQGEQVPYEPLQTTIVPPPVNPNFVESNPPSPATSLAYLQNGGQEDWSDFDIPVVEIMNPPPKTKGAQKPSKKAPQTANTRSDQQSAVPAPVPVPVPAPVSSPSRNGQYEVHSNHPPGQFQQPRHYQGSPGKPTQVSPQYSPANNYPQQQLSTQTHQLSPTEAQPYSMRGYTSAPVPAPVPAPQATVPAHQPGHLHRHLPREESTMEDYGSLMDITTTLQELQQKRENFHGMNIPVVDATVSQLGLSAPKMEDYEYFSSESDGSPDGRRNQSYIKFADESSTSMSYYGSTVHMDPFYDEKKLPRVSKKEKALPAVPVRSPEELQPTVATESSSTANAVDPFMFIVSSTQSQTAVEQGEEDVCEDQNQVLEQRPSFGSMNSMGSVSDGNYVAQGPTALEMVMTFETDDATDDKEDKYDVRYRELEGVSVDEVEYVSTADLTATTTLTSELGNTVTATLSEPWSPTVTATASRPMMLVAEGLVEDDDIHIVADTTTVLHGVEDVMNYTAVAACEDMASSAVANDANADDHFNPNVSQFDWNNAESVSVDAARCDVGTDDGFAAFEGDTVVTVEPAVAVESVQEDEEEDDEIPPPPEEEYDEERDGIQDDTPAPLSSVVPVSRRRYVYAPSIDVMVVTAEEETVSSAEEPVDIPLHVEEVIVADVVQEAAEQAEQLAEPQAEVQGEVQGEVQAIEVSVIPSSVPVPNVQEIVGCEEPVVEPSPVESRVREIPPSFLAESSTSISDTVTAVPPAMTSERTDEQVGFDMPTPASVSSTASVRHRPSDPSFEAQQELDALNAPYHTSSVAASFPNAVGIAVTSDDQTSHAYSSSGAPSVVSEFDDDQVPVFSIQGQFVITDFAAPTTPFQRRNLQPYFCEQVGNKWRATIVLKQFKLKKNENSPQGSRPDQAALGDCVSEEVCRDLCESFAPPAWAEKGAAENSSCTLCKVAFTMFSKPHHCRNCGYLVCTQCSDKLWPSSMVPSTYHNNEKIVRVCHSCHFLTEQFIVALRKGDFNLVRTLYSSGNINLHQPYTAYVASAYAVHLAAVGGNVNIMKWLVDTKRCSLKQRATKLPLLTQTGWSILGLAAHYGHVELVRYLVHQKGCAITEIKESISLQRAMHALLGAPGPMPELPTSLKGLPAGTVAMLTDDLLCPPSARSNSSTESSASAAAVATDGNVIPASPASSATATASTLPSATASEVPIILSHIESAPAQINALGVSTSTTMAANGLTQAAMVHKPRNRNLCTQAVFLVHEYMENQRREVVYTTPLLSPHMNSSPTAAAAPLSPPSTASASSRHSTATASASVSTAASTGIASTGTSARTASPSTAVPAVVTADAIFQHNNRHSLSSANAVPAGRASPSIASTGSNNAASAATPSQTSATTTASSAAPSALAMLSNQPVAAYGVRPIQPSIAAPSTAATATATATTVSAQSHQRHSTGTATAAVLAMPAVPTSPIVVSAAPASSSVSQQQGNSVHTYRRSIATAARR